MTRNRYWFLACISSDCSAQILGPYFSEHQAKRDANIGCQNAHCVTLAEDPPLIVSIICPSESYYDSYGEFERAMEWNERRVKLRVELKIYPQYSAHFELDYCEEFDPHKDHNTRPPF